MWYGMGKATQGDSDRPRMELVAIITLQHAKNGILGLLVGFMNAYC